MVNVASYGKKLAGIWLRSAFCRFVRQSAGAGNMEIERKFAQTADEAEQLRQRLPGLGFHYVGTAEMADTFLPGGLEGEMLRVRRERIGQQAAKNVLTFKQWVTTPQGRKRKETEREIKPTAAMLWLVVGRFIAGAPLDGFSKQRELFQGTLNNEPCVVSIDNVSGLGAASGWYLEVEVLLPLDADFAPYEAAILRLVADLYGSPRPPVDKSYSQMLAEAK